MTNWQRSFGKLEIAVLALLLENMIFVREKKSVKFVMRFFFSFLGYRITGFSGYFFVGVFLESLERTRLISHDFIQAQ